MFLVITGATASALQSDDFTYSINSSDTNTVTITDYTGSDSVVDIPPLIDGRNVTHIGNDSFYGNKTLQVISIPQSVVDIGDRAFSRCYDLSSVVWTYGITNIQTSAFSYCENLTHISLPSSVIIIDDSAFYYCEELIALTLPPSVSSIGHHCFERSGLSTVSILGTTSLEQGSFKDCINLTGVYFHSNAPSSELNAFMGITNQVTAYYQAGTIGWNSTFDNLHTAFWNPSIIVGDEVFGAQTNGFSFNISESASGLVVVKGCTNLVEGIWKPVQTNSMSGGTATFVDAEWTNQPSYSYKLTMP